MNAIKIKQSLAPIYPWIIWTLAASFFFYKYLIQVSPSVMTDDLMKAFDIHGAGLGNLSAFYFYAYLIMQIPVGIMLDKFSPRLLTTAAIFLCSVSTFLFAHSDSLWLACVYRALMGAGAAFAAVSCFKLAALWFSHFLLDALQTLRQEELEKSLTVETRLVDSELPYHG